MKKINFVFKPESIDLSYEIDDTSTMDYRLVHSKTHSPLIYCFDRNRQANIYTTDSLPEDVFIYEYIQHWWFDEEHFYGLESTGFFNLNPCPENVIQRIREKTAYLAISYPMESQFNDRTLYLMNRYIEYNNLPESQVIYFTCSPNGNDIHLDFCRRYVVSPKFSCSYIPLYPFVYQEMTQNLKYNYNNYPKIKKFLIFNRRWANHPNRTFLLYHLVKNNIIDNSYISFSKTEIDNNETYRDCLNRHLIYFPDTVIDNSIVDTIENSLPLVLDHENLGDDLTFAKFDNTEYLYNTSFINIVTETNFISNIIHITEKTFKPMLYRQPFIILGSKNFLKHIKEMGFKTFENCWSEDYDLEEDNSKRFRMIINLIIEINSWDTDKQQEVLRRCRSSVIHNYILLKNFHNSMVAKSQ